MKSCKRCGSCAINEHAHGRVKGHNADLCDVCYWRNKAEIIERELNTANERTATLQVQLVMRWEMMRELETECGTNEVGEAVKFIKGLKEQLKRMEDFLNLVSEGIKTAFKK